MNGLHKIPASRRVSCCSTRDDVFRSAASNPSSDKYTAARDICVLQVVILLHPSVGRTRYRAQIGEEMLYRSH